MNRKIGHSFPKDVWKLMKPELNKVKKLRYTISATGLLPVLDEFGLAFEKMNPLENKAISFTCQPSQLKVELDKIRFWKKLNRTPIDHKTFPKFQKLQKELDRQQVARGIRTPVYLIDIVGKFYQ